MTNPTETIRRYSLYAKDVGGSRTYVLETEHDYSGKLRRFRLMEPEGSSWRVAGSVEFPPDVADALATVVREVLGNEAKP